ncbi:MAG TPA: TetR/AcrR family transcriptional regulator [Thermoanaerobaculales bacterium]|nr:TetR/AcrR family transcriptional regulator [Thermoanaerobaculales bacterium]HQN96535.1 TetR/AcrR family transcriptional regulator [Thermoanaerobaculales bacterium]HQP43779.1 TetR/AcrR family transcriptional regulator [Thermoanaerobaculales bacterium]
MQAVRKPDPGVEPSASQRRRRPSRRNEILRRTAHLFFERGFEITSLVDVASACGISKAGLYYHFRSKQELLAAIIHYAHDILEHEIQKELADSRSDEEALRRMIHTHALILTREDDATFAILAVDEMRSLLPDDRAQIARRKRGYLGLIRERLERLAAAGKLRDVDITAATHTLAGMVLWLPKWHRQPGRLSARQMADEITELALHAVLPDGRPRSKSAR